MDKENYLHSDITGDTIKAAYKVYNYFGAGFMEAVYEKSLAIELRRMGREVREQVSVELYYEGGEMVGFYRTDLIVENKVVIELKATEKTHPRHEVQLVNFMNCTVYEVGLLLNFGNPDKLDVIRRVRLNSRKKNLDNM